MLKEHDPLNTDGLVFEDNPYQERGYVKFFVSGFKDKEHASEWSDAYYDKFWGYAPRFNFEEGAQGWKVRVEKRTSCD
jgi:hypothetical protein